MKRELSLKRPEPLEVVSRHPVAGAVGGVVMGLVCGGIAVVVSGSGVAVLMTILGLVIGAPGGAYVAQSVARD